ncbi:protein TolR [Alphaproteobacteria bacterium]|nr:protein TolR [Alphaproteobacteria bacterium]
MAVTMRKSGGRRRRFAPMSEMNVTPMIDVMLVLLVILMATAPLLNVGVKVTLPSANAPKVTGNDKPITVSVDSKGHVFIGDVEVDDDTLTDKLRAITKESMDAKIFVRGDQALSYGSIMKIMGRIGKAGFQKVILVTELPKEQEQRSNAPKKR